MSNFLSHHPALSFWTLSLILCAAIVVLLPENGGAF